MRVAIVHDWLLGMRGGEHCLEVLCCMFPEAEIYTLFYRPEGASPLLRSRKVFPSVLSALPGVERYYRYLLPLFSVGVKSMSRRLNAQHQLGAYDLVISVSHCVAKNIAVPENVPHLCYCLTPARYLWDQYESYFSKHPLEPVIRRIIAPLRREDVKAAQRVDRFAGISSYVAERIRRYYNRPADVVFPPVRTDWLGAPQHGLRGEHYLSVSALVPYKRVDLIVEAFNELGYPLLIVGIGPEMKRLQAAAASNIQFLGSITQERLAGLYKSSKALVFAAEEDFGMVPVEMQAAGGPVIAFSAGGVLETVRAEGVAPTGVFFGELTARALIRAVEEFNGRQGEFTVDNCVGNAREFSLAHFVDGFGQILNELGFVQSETMSKPPGSERPGIKANA